jgi:signal transduction histidine kinase
MFFPFFIGKIYSQKTAFFQHNVELDEAIGQKQLASITKDKNGYYWMLTASHKILKWDGRKFTRIDSLPAYKLSLKDYWFQVGYDNKGTPYYFDAGKITLYIDENSQLKLLRKKDPKEHEIMLHINGPYYFSKIQWDAVNKVNNAVVADIFYKSYADYDNSRIYELSSGKFYLRSKFGLHYYNNDTVTQIVDKEMHGCSVFLIESSLVLLFANGEYKVYTNGSLMASGIIRQAGFPQSFHDMKLARVTNYWEQRQSIGGKAYFASGDCIYSLILSNNKPVISKYFVIPGDQQYIEFYCDLEKERFFLINPSGGFTYFEKNAVFTFSYRESIDSGVLHSITNSPDGVLRSNKYFQQRVKVNFDTISAFLSVSPIVYHKDRYYYFVSNTAFVLNTAGQVTEKIPIPQGGHQIFAAVATDSVVYFQNGNLYAVVTNNRTSGIKELAFYENGTKIGINYIENGGNHLLYASSKSNGHIYELNVKQLSAKKISRSPISKCRSICYDKKKNLLLIATYGNGPLIISLADGRQIELPLDASSSLLSCHYMLSDRDGDWWLPTNAGLFYLSADELALYLAGKIQTLAYRQIEKEFNVPSMEYNGAFSTSGIMSGDSAFFSSSETIAGINIVYVKKLFNESRAVIFLDEIKMNGAIVGLDDLKGINPGYKSLDFKFSIPFIQHPGLLLQYRILGYKDTTWHHVPDDKLSLGFLAPGNYTLQVRTTNGRLLEMKQIPVVINAYWYNTPVARILFLAGILLFIGFVVRSVILKNRNDFLEQVNREKQEIFRVVAHDLKSPVSLYRGLTDLASFLIQKKDFERLKKVSEEIDETGQELDLLLNNLLHWSLVDNERFIFKMEQVVVKALLDQILPIYKRIAAVKNISIELRLDDEINICSNYNGLSVVFRNLLDNAVKYAVPGTVLTVESNIIDFSYNFKVSNSISIQHGERLAAIKQQGSSKNDGDVNPISGLGMEIIKKMLLKLGGQLFIVVENNKVICQVVISV